MRLLPSSCSPCHMLNLVCFFVISILFEDEIASVKSVQTVLCYVVLLFGVQLLLLITLLSGSLDLGVLRSCSEHAIEVKAEKEQPLLWSHPGLSCDGILAEDSAAIAEARNWKVDVKQTLRAILASKDRCSLYSKFFSFRTAPLSEEEANFPLAYGILVHKDFVQFLLMLSSFYHPQNVYCVAVSGSAYQSFLRLVHGLPDCFDNVHVIQVDRVRWSSFEIISAVHQCMAVLDSLIHPPWRYFQYLSGVDVPLRTNLEMVRILNALKGSINAEASRFQSKRLANKKSRKPPLPLFKSSLSAVLPRSAIHVLVHDTTALALLRFLNGTITPDESYWASVSGNPHLLPLPGGWNASEIVFAREKNNRRRSRTQAMSSECIHPPCISQYYISRFQIWRGFGLCRGAFTASSCVFGVADVASLLRRPHLVAHKLYLSFEPAALFCALREIDKRSRNPDPFFNHSQYAELPQVELSRGIALANLSHPDWLT